MIISWSITRGLAGQCGLGEQALNSLFAIGRGHPIAAGCQSLPISHADLGITQEAQHSFNNRNMSALFPYDAHLLFPPLSLP
jgi:hypothetical protein